MKNSQKGFIFSLLIIIALLIVGGGLYYYSQKSTLSENVKIPTLPFENQNMADLSVPERQQYNDAIEVLDSNVLFTLWQQLEENNKDPLKRDFVTIQLSWNLKKDSDKTRSLTYSNINKFLRNNSKSVEVKSHLIAILGVVASKQSLEIILAYSEGVVDPQIKQATQMAIIKTTNTDDGFFREELSPTLEEAYLKSSNENDRLTFSTALAKIGAPSGITLLLKDATQNGTRQGSAQYALLETRNPKAIPILAKGLRDQTIDNPELLVSGEILATMGQPEATKVIIDWARNYKGDASGLIYKWLMLVRDGTSSDMLLNTIKEQLSFANKKNKDALAKAVKDWCGHRSGTIECK